MDIRNIKKEWNATILDILKAFIAICEENSLRYYCCGGTAIGAVRHGGMIPWDDDIDVMMPRPDYDRLIEIAGKKDFGKYELKTPYNDDAYPLYFSKLMNRHTTLIEDARIPCVLGLYIDIFPIDATSDDEAEAMRLKDKYTKIINRLNAISTHNTFGEYFSLLKKKKEWGRFAIKTMAFFCRSRLRNRFIRQMDEMSHQYDFDKSRNVLVYTGSYGHKELFPKSWLGEGRKFPFDGLNVTLVEHYDDHLRHFFGNYMQLPPVEQRNEKHSRVYVNMIKRESLNEIKAKAQAERN